jgi:hypothetical protein
MIIEWLADLRNLALCLGVSLVACTNATACSQRPAAALLMRSAIPLVTFVLAALVGLYFYGSPKYRILKKECIEAGMDHSDTPSDDDLHRLWMDCRRIGFGPPL